MTTGQPDRDPSRPVYVISVAASSSASIPGPCASTRTRGCSVRPAPPPTSGSTARTTSGGILWIRHLTQNLGVNLAGIRILFELEERLGAASSRRSSRGADRTRPPSRGIRGRAPADDSSDRRPATQPPSLPRPRHQHPEENPMAKRPSDARSTSSPPTTTAGPRELPLVALRETVIFPEMIVPLQVGREKSVDGAQRRRRRRRADRARDPAPGRAGGHHRPVRALRGRHAGQDRPGRPAPGRHRARHRPGPAAPARRSASAGTSRTSSRASRTLDGRRRRPASRSRR